MMETDINNKQQTKDICLEEITYKSTTSESNNKNQTELLETEKKDGSNKFVYIAAFTANLTAFTCGLAFAWTSPVIPKLNGSIDPDNNPLSKPITASEESWIASLLSVGCTIGPLVAGRTADKIGRKKTLIILSLPIIISLLLSAYAKIVQIFYISRLLMGFSVGSVFVVLPMYLGEIAEDHNRGTLGCSFGVFLTLGILFCFVVGPFVSVQNFCLISIAPLAIFIPTFAWFIPESPYYLAAVHDERGVRQSLKKLRSTRSLQPELLKIKKSVDEANRQQSGGSDYKQLFQTKSLRNGLIIGLGLVILQQFAGINAVMSYMHSIFDATGSEIAATTSTIIIGIVQVLATILTFFIVDRLGRRILLLLSATASCFSLFGLGIYFYLQINNYEITKSLFWLPIFSLLVYIIAFNIGLGPLPWAIMAELFPSNVKSLASTLVSVSCFIASFVITFFFPYLSILIGMAQSFWVFTAFCLIATIFIYVVVPETKGKTLEEIQEVLGRNSR